MQHQQRQFNGYNETALKIVEDNSQQTLQFVLPQAPDKMNQQAVPQLRGGPASTGAVPFYNYRGANPQGPPRHNLQSNTYTTPTLSLQQGSSIVQNSPIGSHPQLYTVYMNGNGTNQTLQNRPNSVPQAQYSYPTGQEVVQQQYPPQFYQTYQTNPPGANYAMINPALFQTTAAAGWSMPQHMIPYQQQPTVYGGPTASTLVQQPPPPAVQPHVQPAQPPSKRERHPLVIVDPNTQENIIEKELKENRKKQEESFSKESTSSSSSIIPQQTINYQQAVHQSQQQQQNNMTNYYNTNQQNVQYQQKPSSDETNSQTNSRGQTPHSRSVTPTDAHQNYSTTGPPLAAPNIGGGSSSSSLTSTKPVSVGGLPVGPGQQNEQDASQKVYCELALNIARQTCVPSTTPPPPASTSSSATVASPVVGGQQDSTYIGEETPSASQASITLHHKQQTVVSSSKIETTTLSASSNLPQSTTKSFAAAASSSASSNAQQAQSTSSSSSLNNERRPKEILSSQNNEILLEKSEIGVSFGFFDTTTDDSTASNDDSLNKTPRHERTTPEPEPEPEPIIAAVVPGEIASAQPSSTSTPVKEIEERKINEQSPELRVTPVKEQPTFRVTTPYEDGQFLAKPKYGGRSSLTDLSTKSTTDANDLSLEEGEIKDNTDDETVPPTKNAYENEIKALRALQTQTPDIWSVENPNGKLVWSREFMMAIGQMPMSKGQPDDCVKSTVRTHDVTAELFTQKRGAIASSPRDSKMTRGSTDGRGANFQPSWQQQVLSPIGPKAKFMGRGSTGGGGGGGRQGSRQGQGGGGGDRNKPPMVIPRPSVTQEVQLKKAEHAWKPKLKQNVVVDDPEKSKTEELYRKVKSILNKITPQTFDDLSEDLMALEPEMNTPARTSGVIDIVFQKVCDEPGFCETYGRLCELLSNKQIKSGERDKTETFRYQLLTKCQQNFEMDKNTERLKEQKLAEIESAETEELKKQMTADLDEALAKNKWRTLGSIRFVGELYKRKLLTKFIAQYCVQHLLSKQNDEESIECLCKFLTTIGKTLEEDTAQSKMSSVSHNVQAYFDNLLEIMETQQVSKRIQFEIKNLVELRENKWIPRRKEAGPKKIDEIHSEAKMEEIQQRIDIQQRQSNQMQQQQLQPRGSQQGQRGQQGQQHRGGVIPSRGSYNNEDDFGRRGDRGGGGRPSDRDRDRDRNAKDNKNVRVPVVSNLSQETRHIDNKSLSKHLNAPAEEVTLGPKKWAQRSTTAQPPAGAASTAAKTNNRFQQLSDDGRRDSAPSSRESSQTRAPVSDRQAALDAASMHLGRRPPTSPETPSTMSREASPNRPYSTEPAEQEFDPTDEKFKRFALELFDEFVTSGVYDEAERLVAEKKSYFVNMMQIWLENVIEKTSKERFKLGEMIARLISKNVVPLDAAVNGFDQFVQMVNDSGMETDVPLVWPYLGAVLGAVIVHRGSGGSTTLRLGDFHSAFQSAGQKSHDLLAHTLLTVQSASSEQNLREVWANETWSQYQLNNTNEVDNFLKKHNINCLSPDVMSSTSSVQNGSVVNNNDRIITIDPNLVELERYVKSMNPVVDPEQLINWIEAHVTNKTSVEFVRALARSFCSKVFVDLCDGDYNVNEDQFDGCCRVFQRYLTGRAESEVALLLELAKYYYDKGCPRDILARLFGILSDNQVMPRESFMEWWRLERETNTHGMILKNSQINRFMDTINQDQDGDSSANESSDEKTTDTVETVIATDAAHPDATTIPSTTHDD